MQLKINQPCQQKFEHMQPMGNGRFCGACLNVVVDFTQFSDEQLMDFFRKQATGICGRLRADQMNVPLKIPAGRFRGISIASYVLGFGLAGLLPANKAEGAIPDTIPAQTPIHRPVPLVALPVLNRVSGTVLDMAGAPLDEVSIQVMGTAVATRSNKDGTFTLAIPDSIQKSYVQIQVEADGYFGQFISVAVTDPHLRIQMQSPDALFLGKIATTGCVYVKRTWWQRVKDWFR